jgi:histidine triad (HIT) family protein
MNRPREAGGHAGGSRKDSLPSATPKKSSCFFCGRLREPGSIEAWRIYEDDLLVATHQVEANGPTYLGTVMVQTRRHTEGLGGLTDREAERLGLVVTRISRALRSTLGAEWTYAYCFTEAFRHVHTIVDARYPGLPKEYVRLGIHEWPLAPRGDAEAVRRLVIELRVAMARASAA